MTALNCNLHVVDNSGAKVVRLIGILKKSRKKLALGDIVRVSVQQSTSKNIPVGSKRYAIVCGLKSPVHRNNPIYAIKGGLTVRMNYNGVAILSDDKKKWIATAIKGAVGEEVRKFPEIVSKAEVVF